MHIHDEETKKKRICTYKLQSIRKRILREKKSEIWFPADGGASTATIGPALSSPVCFWIIFSIWCAYFGEVESVFSF